VHENSKALGPVKVILSPTAYPFAEPHLESCCQIYSCLVFKYLGRPEIIANRWTGKGFGLFEIDVRRCGDAARAEEDMAGGFLVLHRNTDCQRSLKDNQEEEPYAAVTA
jgi:hypothetical protein